MKISKNRLLLILILAALLCLSGCGPKRAAQEMAYGGAESGGYNAGGGYTMAKASMDMAASEEMLMDEAEYDTAYEDYSAASYNSSVSNINGADSSEDPSPVQEETDRVRTEKLVYTGNLTVETTDFSSTMERIRGTITEMGGFIESEDDSDYAYGWYREDYTKSSSTLQSYIRARIPSTKFYEFLDGIEGDSAKVTNRSVNVENISRRYSETASTIESYEIQERRLLDMMEEAKRVSDMLEIEARLSEVQMYLKQYRNSLADMDTDVAYSTVSISVQEVGIYSRPEATSFGEKIREAFSDGIQSFREGAETFCLWVTGNILNILVTVLVLWLAFIIIRKLVRKIRRNYIDRREKKNEQKVDDKGE